MALSCVTFGNFEVEHVKELFQNNSGGDLDFVWQKKKHMLSEGELVNAVLLNIPAQARSYSPGGASPNIPPNPPTTPVEEYRTTPSKLNVNAAPFVPSHVSVISGGGDEDPPDKQPQAEDKEPTSKKLLDFTQETSTTKPAATVSSPSEHPPPSNAVLSNLASNDKHTRSVIEPCNQTESCGKTEPCGEKVTHVMVGSFECDLVQTVGQSSSAGGGSLLSDVTRKGEGPCEGIEFCSARLSDDSGTGTSSVSHSEKSIPHSVSNASTRTNSFTEHQSLNSQPESGSVPPPSLTPSHTPSTPSQQTTPTATTPTSTSLPTSPTIATVVNNRTTKSWASIVSSKNVIPMVTTNTPHPSSSAQPNSTAEGGTTPATSLTTLGVASGDKAATACGDSVTASSSGGANTQLRALGEFLSLWSLSHCPVSILPRGLTNQGNWCYTHAPLQALLGIPAIHNVLKSLSPYPVLSREPSATPLTDSLIQFVHEFQPYPKSTAPVVSETKLTSKKKRSQRVADLIHGEPFRPDYIYSTLPRVRASLSHKGRQEDAEEFLGCVLDRLHEEMVLARKAFHSASGEGKGEEVEEEGVSVASGGSEGGEGGDDEWEQVGPKNKSTVTRQLSLSDSPITEIFGGEVRSAVHRHGAKESATVEPFFTLQLDIQRESTWSIKDALDVMATRETVHMNTSSKVEVEAFKRLTLARLPPVLTLHLKRFIFNKTGGSQKVLKYVQYGIDLEVGKDLLAPAIRHKLLPSQRQYKLWAVVYHHGKSATGGHYTSDVLHPACGGWVRMDDGILKMVPEEFVLKPSQGSNKVAYLLFYRRLDTIRT